MFNQGNKKLTAARIILLTANFAAAAALILADLANYISPAMSWQIAMFGLAFPFIVFINLGFFFYWLFRRRTWFLISALVLLMSWKNISSTVQFHFNREKANPESAFKIMSFNVRLFDLYHWTHNMENRNKIYHFLKDESPDILCIQEFFSSSARKFNNTDTLADFLSDKKKKYYYDVEVTETMNADDQVGAAIFSAFPIVGKGKIIFETKSHNICMWTDLMIGKDTVRVYNIHMQSIRFENEDYLFLENIYKEKEQEEIKGSMKILRRLKKAFIKRSNQSDLVSDHIHHSPYPVMVCGDFNDTPSSYTYQKLSENLEDTFKETGWGFSKTYVGIFPSFRIDYLLHDKKFKSYEYRTVREKLSDHYPVTCFLEWK